MLVLHVRYCVYFPLMGMKGAMASETEGSIDLSLNGVNHSVGRNVSWH